MQSLLATPLLVGDLPNAPRFDRHLLFAPNHHVDLNFDQKLGHLYEDAFAALLDSSPNIDLLQRNLQVQRNSHLTLGELDFLIRDHEGHLTHLEIAVKFYLSVKSKDGIIFPGPDSRDNYDRKIQRLLSHQLTLTQRYKGDLPPRYRAAEIFVRQLIYGCLFDHITDTKANVAKFCNPNCRRGKWLRHCELTEYFSPSSRFDLIPKHFWPVPIELLRDVSLQKWQCETTIERCQMIRVNDDLCPYFITPDEYPEQT